MLLFLVENLLPVGLLVRTNLLIPSRFGLLIRILALAVSARCDKHKTFYIGAHLHILR